MKIKWIYSEIYTVNVPQIEFSLFWLWYNKCKHNKSFIALLSYSWMNKLKSRVKKLQLLLLLLFTPLEFFTSVLADGFLLELLLLLLFYAYNASTLW